MADWDGFRGVLNELYLVENKSLTKVMEIMAKKHKFAAPKSEYETQFKKWDWQKNMKKSDWLYVARKSDLRKKAGQPETAVFLRGIRVLPSKVKKEASRQVRPSELYTLATLPPCPEYMTVCTPPPEYDEPSLVGPKRKPRHLIVHETSNSKRRLVESMSGTMHVVDNDFLPLAEIWKNNFHETGKVDLSGLPYFQFREIMGSSNVIKGFKQLLTSHDALAGDLMPNFWSGSSRQSIKDSNTPSSIYLILGLEPIPDTACSLFPENQALLFKPFGANLFYDENHCEGIDTFDILDRTRAELSSILVNMPQNSDEEVQSLTNILLGSPTIDAARRFVEVGVYICSNRLGTLEKTDRFVDSMLKIVPWPNLAPILSVQAPTIQAFTETVLMYTIKTGQIDIVRELLRQQSLLILVRSNIEALLSAIRTSNTDLVSLLLAVGANVEGNEFSRRPLIEARTLAMARLLVDAGANVNVTGAISHGYCPKWQGTAVHQAIRRGKQDMVTYFVSVGADISLCKAYSLDITKRTKTACSALMLSVEHGSVKICRALLQAGASMISDVVGRPPECNHCIQGTGRYISCEPHMTVFQRAAALGDCAIVELLLEYKAQINTPAYGKHGMTALEAAVSNSKLGAVRLLLDNGANVNAPCSSRKSFPRYVLTTAVEMNHYQMVEILLDAGANISVPSFGTYGSVALESAMVMDKGSDILRLLVTRGYSLQTGHVSPHYYQARLRKAVEKGDLALIQCLFKTEMRIDLSQFLFTGCRHEMTILQYSIQNCKIGGTAIFHALFSTVTKSGEHIDLYPLVIEATKLGSLEILAALLNAGADLDATRGMKGDIFGTPLMFAVHHNNRTTALWLLDKGANVNVVVEGFGDVRATASTALQVALQQGRWGFCDDMYHLLLDHGATVNGLVSRIKGRSELAFAVIIGKTALVQHLLELGARVNDQPAANHGLTALQVATGVWNPQIATIQMLLDWGANVNGPSAEIGGVTALGAAAQGGHFQVALILLKAGAAINALDGHGCSPLINAAFFGRLDMVYLLLKAGADITLSIQGIGYYAKYIAQDGGHIAIVDLLENWEKNDNSRFRESSSEVQPGRTSVTGVA